MVANIFTCPGDVAQLGERLGRIEEVEGSIPFVSTTGYVKASVTRPFSCLSSLLSPRRSDMHRPQAQGCASKHTRCVMRLAARTRPTLPPRATSLDITRARDISDGMLYITHRLRIRPRAGEAVPTPRQKPQALVTTRHPQTSVTAQKGHAMRLTIETMTYGPDGLARTPEGKAVFVAGGLIGDTVEARICEDGPSFSRAVVEEVLEPSPDRVQPPCPFIGICGGCPWGGLSHEAQLQAKEENLRSALARIGKFSPEEVDDLMRPIRHAKDAWGYRQQDRARPRARKRQVPPGDARTRRQPDHQGRFLPALREEAREAAVKAVAGALGSFGNSRDLQLERVGIRSSRRTGALEVALWTPTGRSPARNSPVLSDAVRATAWCGSCPRAKSAPAASRASRRSPARAMGRENRQ